MSVSLAVTGLCKTYRDAVRVVEVLRGVDLTVEPGELVAVTGQSGSGKSTLLHLLGGLDQPDAGEIEVAGVRVDQLSPDALADFRGRTVGFIFQFFQLLADFTALENVMLPGRIAGRPARVLRDRAMALLAEVRLADRADHFPGQLSGGEQQRVALCRALLLEPPLLLADEPTGNLDLRAGETVLELLLDLQKRRGTTALLVTHNPAIARRCGRILALEGGLLQPASA